jgi:uncharacterized protein YdaU (DUF1376 family)
MDVDVRCLPYMPLQIEQLRKSKTWIRCRRQPELGFYLMNLWMRAWHEVPAGSIEDDDDVLADAAMCSPEQWEQLRPVLLQGWELHNGRLYHKTVTDLATEGFSKLRKNKQRTEAARKAAEEKRLQDADTDSENPVTDSVTDPVRDTVTGPEGKGREGNIIEPYGSLSGSGPDDAPKRKKAVTYPKAFDAFWGSYPRTPNMSKTEAFEAWRKLSSEEQIACTAAVSGYIAFLKNKPDLETIHACRFISKRRFEGFALSGGDTAVAPETWAKRLKHARTQSTWASSQWGPMPGQPGCNVPNDLLLPSDGHGWREWEQAA